MSTGLGLGKYVGTSATNVGRELCNIKSGRTAEFVHVCEKHVSDNKWLFFGCSRFLVVYIYIYIY